MNTLEELFNKELNMLHLDTIDADTKNTLSLLFYAGARSCMKLLSEATGADTPEEVKFDQQCILDEITAHELEAIRTYGDLFGEFQEIEGE